MQSKDGSRSKTPRTKARADTKNGASIRPYDSGSECEFESVSGTDSESNVNEEPPSQGRSLERSLSESSTDDFFHTDSSKHTKFRTSDVISSYTSQHSDITDELVLPISSLTQSPPVQVMDRNGGRDLCRRPSFSSESSSSTRSSISGDSLFSLQINSNSFINSLLVDGATVEPEQFCQPEELPSSNTNSYSFTESEEFCQLEELQSSNMNRSNELVKLRQPRPEERGPNVSIQDAIPRKNVDDHPELSVEACDGLSCPYHPASRKNDFVLPLSFPITKEKSMHENKKKKKKKGGFSNCSCKFCSFPSCSLKCLSCSGCRSSSPKCLSCSGWPSCSLKCLSCSGCCKFPCWRSRCCHLPSCCCK